MTAGAASTGTGREVRAITAAATLAAIGTGACCPRRAVRATGCTARPRGAGGATGTAITTIWCGGISVRTPTAVTRRTRAAAVPAVPAVTGSARNTTDGRSASATTPAVAAVAAIATVGAGLTISSRRCGVRTIGTGSALATGAALPSNAASAADQGRGVGAHRACRSARATSATCSGITTS